MDIVLESRDWRKAACLEDESGSTPRVFKARISLPVVVANIRITLDPGATAAIWLPSRLKLITRKFVAGAPGVFSSRINGPVVASHNFKVVLLAVAVTSHRPSLLN